VTCHPTACHVISQLQQCGVCIIEPSLNSMVVATGVTLCGSHLYDGAFAPSSRSLCRQRAFQDTSQLGMPTTGHSALCNASCSMHIGSALAGTFCPAPDVAPCGPSWTRPDPCADCKTCLEPGDLNNGRPTTGQMTFLLPRFLQAKPSKSCAKGGLGVYSPLFERGLNDSQPAGLSSASVTSAFRALSTPLSRQADFIDALLASRKIVDEVQKQLDDVHEGM
jgi:hypothetical protein